MPSSFSSASYKKGYLLNVHKCFGENGFDIASIFILDFFGYQDIELNLISSVQAQMQS